MLADQTSQKVYGYLEKADRILEEGVRGKVFTNWSDKQNNELVIRLAQMLQKEEHESKNLGS